MYLVRRNWYLISVCGTILTGFLSTQAWATYQSVKKNSDCAALVQSLEQNIDQVQAAIDTARAADHIAGMTYAIFTDECLLAEGQSGSVSVAGGQLYPDRTLFRQASVSKLFTTLTLSKLFEKGVLNPDSNLMDLTDAPIVQYILSHDTPERILAWSKIKLKDLMAHQSGISKDLPGALLGANTESLADNSYPSFSELYEGITKIEFLFEPGHVSTGLKYSNMEKNILARIVEAYSPDNLSFRDFVAEQILQPLGMNHTFYDIPDEQIPNMAQGYGSLLDNNTRTVVPLTLRAGAYDGAMGIASTAHDMAQLGQQILKMVSGHSVLLKDQDLITDYVTPVSAADQTLAFSRGTEWDVLPNESAGTDPIWLGHEGTGASERSSVLVSPEKNIGVVLLFNAEDAYREKYVKMISDLIPSQSSGLNDVATERVATARNFLVNTPTPVNVTPAKYPHPEELTKYVGNYFADIIGSLPISFSDDGYLVLAGQKLIVEDASAGRFRFPPVPGPNGINISSEPVVFSFDDAGNPLSFRMSQVFIFKKTNLAFKLNRTEKRAHILER